MNMKSSSYLMEAFILGFAIYWGLTTVEMNVTVNVTDKPIMTSIKNAGAVQNVERESKH